MSQNTLKQVAVAQQAVQSVNGSAHEDGEGKGLLGVLAWWGSWEVKVPFDTLADLASANGLDARFLPKPTTPERAFRRAASDAESAKNGVRLDRIVSSAVEITYGVVEQTVDKEGRRSDWRQVARITWLPKQGTLVSDNNEHAAVQRVRAKLPTYATCYATDDITAMVSNVMKATNSVSLTAAMGVAHGMNSRFVPGSSLDTLRALKGVLRGIKGASFFSVDVADTEDSLDSMQQAARSDLGRMIEDAEATLVDLTEKMADASKPDAATRGPKDATLQKTLTEYANAEAQMHLYEQVLRFKADDLRQRLAAAQDGVQQLLGLRAAK